MFNFALQNAPPPAQTYYSWFWFRPLTIHLIGPIKSCSHPHIILLTPRGPSGRTVTILIYQSINFITRFNFYNAGPSKEFVIFRF